MLLLLTLNRQAFTGSGAEFQDPIKTPLLDFEVVQVPTPEL